MLTNFTQPAGYIFRYLKSLVSALEFRVFGGRGALRGLARDTFSLQAGSISDVQCADFISKFEDVLTKSGSDKTIRVWTDQGQSDCRIFFFERVLTQEQLLSLRIPEKISSVKGYTGRQVKSWGLMANRVVFTKNNLGSGGGWHRDSPYSHQIKFIWYLTDVDIINGAFEVVPNTNCHRWRVKLGLGRYRYDGPEVPVELANVVVGSKGSLITCDTHAVHRGRPIASGHRYAITLYTSHQIDGVERTFLGL